jgi:hypothetical protein
MQAKTKVLIGVCTSVVFAMGFFTHAVLDLKNRTVSSNSQTLEFDSDVVAYSYSEKGVVLITKIDNRTYSLNAVSPGMCVLTFRTKNDNDKNDHLRSRMIVSVSPNHVLAVQETNAGAVGGML